MLLAGSKDLETEAAALTVMLLSLPLRSQTEAAALTVMLLSLLYPALPPPLLFASS